MGFTWLRLIKLLVLVGTPVLGGLYAYQFTAQDSGSQKVVPFKTFQIPQTSLKSAFDPNGESVQFSPTSPVTLVNFWATWCPPCVEEFPAMVELQRQLKDKGLTIVFISIDDDWSKVEKFLVENVIEISKDQLFWDPTQEAAAAWGSEKFPESYVLRRDGWIVEKIIGQQAWTRDSVVEYFEALGSKFQKVDKFVSLGLLNSAYAQSSSVINDNDRKTLETLRKNVEIADKNLRNAEAALKTESRSVSEQESILQRRIQEVSEAKLELVNFEKKISELRLLKQKYESSLKIETKEKDHLKDQMASSRKELSSLETQIESLKDKLTQLQKTLNTRQEGVETSQEALSSAESELSSFEKKKQSAQKVVDSQIREQKKSESLLKDRQSSLAKLQTKIAELTKALDQQKKKLLEAEKIINE